MASGIGRLRTQTSLYPAIRLYVHMSNALCLSADRRQACNALQRHSDNRCVCLRMHHVQCVNCDRCQCSAAATVALGSASDGCPIGRVISACRSAGLWRLCLDARRGPADLHPNRGGSLEVSQDARIRGRTGDCKLLLAWRGPRRELSYGN